MTVAGSTWITTNSSEPLVTSDQLDVAEIWHFADDLDAWEEADRLVVANERAYVLDVMARRVHVVTPNGDRAPSIGKRGRGPGELERPFGVAVVGDLLAVGDGAKGALEVFHRFNGRYVRTIRTSKVGGIHVFAHHGGVAIIGLGREWYALDGSSSGAFATPASWRLPVLTADPTTCGLIRPDADLIFRWSCVAPLVEVWSDSGAIGFFTVDRLPEELGDSARAALRRRMTQDVSSVGYGANRVQELVDGFMETVGSFKRHMQTVIYDSVAEQFVLLEQVPEEQGSGPGVLHLFGRHGIYLAAFNVGAPVRDVDAEGGDIWALVEDPTTGLVTLHRYRIRLPQALLHYVETLVSRALLEAA